MAGQPRGSAPEPEVVLTDHGRLSIADCEMLLSTDHGTTLGNALSRAVSRLAGAGSVAEIVAVLRDQTRTIVGSDGIAVILREGDSCFYAAEDAIEPLWRGQRFPMTACISGWAMLHNRSVIIPDIEGDPRVPQASYRRTSMRTLVMVPMGSPEPVAALGAYWCAYVEPDDTTIRRMETLAHVSGRTLSRVGAIRETEATLA